MVAVLIASAVGIGIVGGAWRIDRNLNGGGRSVRLILTLVLLGASSWLITLIQAAHWLQVPGAYGPVQYATDARGTISFVFHMRVLSFFIVLGCMLVAAAVVVVTIADLNRPGSTAIWRIFVIPAVALTGFAIALQLFFSRGFFPTA